VKLRSRIEHNGLALVLAGTSAAMIGCNGNGQTAGNVATGDVGSVGLALSVAPGVTLLAASYTITGPNSFSKMGNVDLTSASAVSFVVGALPAGSGYSIEIDATSSDGGTTCGGTATFAVTAHQTTAVNVHLLCHLPATTGSVSINGQINVCPIADGVSANPADIAVGFPTMVGVTAHDPDNGPSPLSYLWSAPTGTFSSTTSATPTFTCANPGPVTLTVTVSDGDPSPSCADSLTLVVTCEPGTLLVPSSLVISTSTYDHTQGAVASLAVGSKLANTNTATTTAVAGNLYPLVWNNAGGTPTSTPPVAGDGSFGVTSEITISDVNATTAQVLSRVNVPTNQVVTSFSSKSELGLHVNKDMSGVNHLVFVAYAGPGVGAIDVSNSDAVANQDPTNPVTFAFGTPAAPYFFPRTIVSMDGTGTFSYTPTQAYGGNNGRSALLGSTGLYYTVGNANNGNATTFGVTPPASTNVTSPDVTETTGVEVFTPINAATSSVAAEASTEVNPLIQYSFGTPPKSDKPGKDNNYRGITEFGGALYFTKGSGSNGMDTVYTVADPTLATAATSMITVVPGFPTDSAKATGGNFTPFAVFFANATTMYVSDEGSGNTTTC
jgi:hypothetical protein